MIAILDVGWVAAAIAAPFTENTSVFVAAGVLLVGAVGLGWRDRNARRDRSSWRYWTEPRLDHADRWSPVYWGTATVGFGLIATVGFRHGLIHDEMSTFSVPATFATLTGWGWWRAAEE